MDDNHLKDPLKLLFWVVVVLLLLGFVPRMTLGDIELRHVNLLSDINPAEDVENELAGLPKPKSAFKDSCPPGMTCIEDYADTGSYGMARFYEALSHLKTLGRPVRIAYFGDSYIEGDILVGCLRHLLQKKYGGDGVGFVDIDPEFPGIRLTVLQNAGGWGKHYLNGSSGYDASKAGPAQSYFIPSNGAYTEATGVRRPYAGQLDTFEVASIYLKSSSPVGLEACADGRVTQAFRSRGTGTVESVRYEQRMGKVRWTVKSAGNSLFYGMALEGKSGISVDNFSKRATSGVNLQQLPATTLRQFNAARPYDLVVLHFGLNVAGKNVLKYGPYMKQMGKVISNIKQGFPDAGILVVSVGDREGKLDDGELHTLPGIKALVRYQQELAADNGVAYWNLYEAMGGEGSMTAMVNAKPSMGRMDYTHINWLGGEKLAGIFFKALTWGQQQYEKRKKYEAR